MLRVEQVKTWSSTWDFLELPHQVHGEDSLWVAPLRLYERIAMGSLRARDRAFWLVKDGHRVVARLGAMIHPLGALHFGFFECLEGYPEAVPLLLAEARRLGAGRRLVGPYQFDLEEPYTGVLVDGFEHEPMFLMSYNPPYYDDYLQRAGLFPVADLLSYRYRPETLKTDRMASRAQKAARAGVTVQTTSFWQLPVAVRQCVEIANVAWVDNWGYHPPDEDQIQKLLWFSRVLSESDGVVMAYHQGRPVGFMWLVRNLNPILKPARGRLTPRLFLDFLNRKRFPLKARGYGLGVLPESRRHYVPAALVDYALGLAETRDLVEFEVSWVLSDNVPMNALARALGGEAYKTHRVYSDQPEAES